MPDPLWTETGLYNLLRFIRGDAGLGIGGAMYCYKINGEFVDNLTLEGCLELERRGLVVRKVDQPNHIMFVSSNHA